jgi:hypothetical protein
MACRTDRRARVSTYRRRERYHFFCSPYGFCAQGAEGYDRRLTPILFLTTQVRGRECIHD